MDKAITLPLTDVEVENIELRTSANEVRVDKFKATPGELANVKLTPVSQVAGAGTSLLVTLTTRGMIPKGGKIQIVTGEFWN